MKNEIPVYDISSFSSFRKEDLLVSRFGIYSINHKHLHYAHRHSFYHIVFFTQGSGTHAIDFQNFDVKPYQIYFMIPGQVHSWNFSGPVDGFVINFSSTFFQSFLLLSDYLERFSFFSGNAEDSVVNLPEASGEEVVAVFERLLEQSVSNNKFSADYVRILLLEIFIKVSGFTPEKEEHYVSSYNYTVLKNFQQLIDKNFSKLKLPKGYAELLYITPNHLNALCNDLLGMPAGEVIRKRIILEAKRLLVNLDLSVTEVSYQLNFKDNSYFSKFFKKQVGFTPEEFRKRAFKKEEYGSVKN